MCVFFIFKQKTAYEMRISYWSSDVCSSDLRTQLSGQLGGPNSRIEARLDRLPLSILDIYNEDLGLGGVATGTLSYSSPQGGMPSGRAELRLRGMTRSGLAVSSRPVDVGLNAVIGPSSAAARAVIVSRGKNNGRAQARLSPMSAS